MFDLRDPASTRVKHAESPIPATQEEDNEDGATAVHPLDSPEALESFYRLLDAYTRELDRQEPNREDQAIDEDFYDNTHWREDDANAVRDRGQVPLVFNVIATTVDWVLGTEKRGRSDFHVLPRRKEDAKPAERKSQILKYLSDCNRTIFHRSRAFADAVKAGIGWLEDCYEDDDGAEPIVSRYESWRNMLWDSTAQSLDIEDGRYVFRSKWVDLDIAKAIFKDRAGLLDMSARDSEPLFLSGDYGDEAMDRPEIEMERIGSSSRMPNRYTRERVRIIEAWYKVPAMVSRVSGGMFTGEIYDERSPGHADAIKSGDAEVRERTAMRVHVALFTTQGLLWNGPSPYRHNRYPFTPIWGNRRGRDGMPYGLIRRLRDLNEDLNKRASKALFLLSTSRVIADEGAAEDMDELFDEARRPDANIVKKTGKEVRVETEIELADAHTNLMARDAQMIQQAAGVTDENLGRKTNATSGIAIERRQDQGSLSTSHYFDNERFAFQVQGEKQLSLVEQFMSERKQFRITNMRGKPEYITVNDGLPENDIVRSKADFVITESDWRSSMREAAAAELMDLMIKLAPANPQLVMVMLDLVVESTDIHNREEIVRRIRELTGMADPDAEEPSEEQIARAKQAEEQAQLERQMQEAALRKTISEAVRNEMQAFKAKAETVRANIASLGGPKRGAVDIAADVMAVPAIAPAADEIMRDVGFVGRGEQEHQIAAETQALAEQQQAEQQAAQVQQQPQSPGLNGLGGDQPQLQQQPGLGPARQPARGE